ncbi:3'-5' exonuclease [Vibrio sp. CAIM 722]|uniref:3'-5' exonuclease n=1 Tax=Vibrio eleionomae TaxID=2653505 RepID=A0A7X4RVR9_9VIBR|nr:exonuclease domain-containing protein [Vibrio eleionomae]MZI94585.1 3'-5' exonuclease [Vibrio eleionomae]
MRFGLKLDSYHHLAKQKKEFVKRYSDQKEDPLLKPYFEQILPSRKQDVRELKLLVLDFETTGFDPMNDSVLSMGWVEVSHRCIQLTSARHLFVRNHTPVKVESVKVHHIVPEKLNSEGIGIDEAFGQLLEAMAGKVVVAHGCVIERRFLAHYIQSRFELSELPVIWLDTLKIEQKRQDFHKGDPDVRLAVVRRRYGLPAYLAHHALVDALSTAEVYLAQIHALFNQDKAPLEVMMKLSQ